MSEASLPNLLVIGAPKAGTTSLHSYLSEHPEISMSSPKELRFYWRNDWRERIPRYASHFDPAARVRGESTPAYALYPLRRNVPERVHELVPDARLIYVLRDPVERVVSHWVQTRADSRRGPGRDRVPRWSLEQVIERPDDPLNGPVWGSRYATQLERYLRLFPAEQILVVDQRDLRVDRAATIRRVFRFLGVDAAFRSTTFSEELNTRSEQRELTGLGGMLWSSVLLPVAKHVPAPARRRLSRSVAEAVHRPVSVPDRACAMVRQRLFDLLASEADRVRRLTGIDFDHWSV